MKEILSSRSKRQLELVELLVDNDWVPFTAASESLNVPVKTLKSDIIELEALLAPATIESSKKYGIRFATSFGFCKTSIYQKFIKSSVEFQLIEKIFLHNFSTIVDLADDLYTSVSTIKRIVLRVNQLLQIEGFTINLKKMQLVGDPHSICNFMQHYFYEKYGVAESLLTPAQLVILDQVGLQIIKQAIPNESSQNLDFSLLNRLRFYTYTVINLLKHNSENQLHDLPEKKFAILTDSYACDEFYSQFHLPLSPTNLNIFFYLIFSDQYIDSLATLRELIKVDRNALLKYQKIDNLLQEIEKKMDCKCDNFDDIFMRLYNLDYQIHGRTYILHNKNKEFLTSIKNLYSHFPMELIHSLQAIFYSNPYKEYMVYEAISILFTNWPNLLDRLEYSTPTMKACLLFNSGLDYMNMLSERINYYLRGRFSCTPLKVTSLDELEKEASAYDCIITNIPEIYINTIPIIVIPLIPDAKSFDKLMLVYEDYFDKN
ncbi:helix-turn-helix domain-containing protein [Enterococcus ureasiticus]|uniref:helix-turn-helix domain-containing protein n=1 Tax=Enterococcus ureasiticus TaxID=903984 RepID=UPI001A909D66|nr:helix-turn-helix domain-containing protein [Enterococcus ureasiticus]MBO0475276.1 helix-turn-helix domain-containing protein [Enterococcus ureasiticus]